MVPPSRIRGPDSDEGVFTGAKASLIFRVLCPKIVSLIASQKSGIVKRERPVALGNLIASARKTTRGDKDRPTGQSTDTLTRRRSKTLDLVHTNLRRFHPDQHRVEATFHYPPPAEEPDGDSATSLSSKPLATILRWYNRRRLHHTSFVKMYTFSLCHANKISRIICAENIT